MTSSGVKRPLDLFGEMANTHLGNLNASAPMNQQQCGVSTNNINTKRRCTSFGDRQEATHQSTYSAFRNTAQVLAPLAEDVASMIRDELGKAPDTYQQANTSSNNPVHVTNTALETPMLTIRQTQLICEKLIRDREQKLREEYDKILINKLTEQYDTFVKYTHDHIEQRYKEPNSHQASYLS